MRHLCRFNWLHLLSSWSLFNQCYISCIINIIFLFCLFVIILDHCDVLALLAKLCFSSERVFHGFGDKAAPLCLRFTLSVRFPPDIHPLVSLASKLTNMLSLVFVALSQIYARFVSWSVSLGNRQTGTDPCGISVFPIAPPYGLVVCAWLYFVEFLFCAISYLTLSVMSGFVSLVNFLFCAVFAEITIRQFCSVGAPMRGMCGLW